MSYLPAPDHMPCKVLLSRGEFIDEARSNRAVPYKIYYPVEHNLKRLPVIVWSHGFGGNRDGASFLSRYVAAHGYVIMNVTHTGTDSSLWEGQKAHPWDILRTIKVPRAASINRFLDIPFALNSLEHWARENPETGALIDWDNLGMSGHSFGAMTTQIMAGMLFPGEEGKLISLKEPRFKAGILYSPVPIRHITDAPHEDVYGPIDLPLFHMTGTRDDSPIENFDYKHRLLVHEYSGAAEKHLLVLKDGDHMVYNGTRGKLEKNPNRARHEEIIKLASLAYWDARLKGDQAAENWLAGGGLGAYISGEGEYKKAG